MQKNPFLNPSMKHILSCLEKNDLESSRKLKNFYDFLTEGEEKKQFDLAYLKQLKDMLKMLSTKKIQNILFDSCQNEYGIYLGHFFKVTQQSISKIIKTKVFELTQVENDIIKSYTDKNFAQADKIIKCISKKEPSLSARLDKIYSYFNKENLDSLKKDPSLVPKMIKLIFDWLRILSSKRVQYLIIKSCKTEYMSFFQQVIMMYVHQISIIEALIKRKLRGRNL